MCRVLLHRRAKSHKCSPSTTSDCLNINTYEHELSRQRTHGKNLRTSRMRCSAHHPGNSSTSTVCPVIKESQDDLTPAAMVVKQPYFCFTHVHTDPHPLVSPPNERERCTPHQDEEETHHAISSSLEGPSPWPLFTYILQYPPLKSQASPIYNFARILLAEIRWTNRSKAV